MAKLTQEQRRELASKAAIARHSVPKATHPGELKIGDMVLPCAVLEDGQRVFSERGFADALGWTRSGDQFAKKRGAQDGMRLPVFMLSEYLLPFISEDLRKALSNPILFRDSRGGRPAHGLDAACIPAICEVWLEARAKGVLPESAARVAQMAEVLVRGLARVGIVALVDEVTGYQADRAKDDLQRLLQMYVAEELRPWLKAFPDEFFRQIYRLHGWEYKEGSMQGPRYVGKLINKYVYEHLPPEVLVELKRRNPSVNGRRGHRHHQLLTEQFGIPTVDRQIIRVVTLMQVSKDKAAFQELYDRAFPPSGAHPSPDDPDTDTPPAP
jgi:hypothetical protein